MALQNFEVELQLSYLRAAAEAQTADEEKISAYRDYYGGEQYIELTARQKEYLTNDAIDFDSFANICPRVVSIAVDRMAINSDGITPADPDAAAYADAATAWWEANRLDSKQVDIYNAVARDGGVAVVVDWDGAKPTFTPNLLFDGETGLVRFHYDSDGNLLFASKRYRYYDPVRLVESNKYRLTLYHPDRIVRYEADSNYASGWRLLSPDEIGGIANPQPWVDALGAPLGIPVIHFDNPAGSELDGVLMAQKMLNHNLGTFDEAVDQQAFPLLWARDLTLPIDPSTGKAEVPTYGPGQMFTLGQSGEMGRIEPAQLETMFRSGVLSWVQVVALVKGWPYFLFDRTSTPPSGVALRIMEAGLVAQIEQKQRALSQAWLDAFNMGRKLHRLNTGQDLPGEITLNWRPVETNDPKAKAEELATKWAAAQIPVLSRWRELGYTEAEIQQMIDDNRRGEEELVNGDFAVKVAQ